MELRIILGEDAEYVKRLEKAFRAAVHPEYKLVCFSDKRNILGYFSLHGADVIVVSEIFRLSEKDFEYKVPVLYLSERIQDRQREIFKYQNMNSILKEIALKYQDLGNTDPIPKEDSGISKC